MDYTGQFTHQKLEFDTGTVIVINGDCVFF